MDDSFQQLKKIIIESSVSVSDKDRLLRILAKAGEEELQAVLTLCTEDPNWIAQMSENYAAKQAATTTSNEALWQKIIKEEENQLEALKE